MDNDFDQEWYVDDSNSKFQKAIAYIIKGLWITIKWLLISVKWILISAFKLFVSWIGWLFINPERRICPYCKTDIPYTATRCHRCRKDLKPKSGFAGRLVLSMVVLFFIACVVIGIMEKLGYGVERESSESNVEMVELSDSIV